MATHSKLKPSLEATAWRWMRYSGILLIPLAWFHVYLQDVFVGVHDIDINYVAARWDVMGWVAYDFFLLLFTFAHGMYGLRQVSFDFIHSERARKVLSISLLIIWLAVSVIGTIALFGGARPELIE